MNNSRDCKQKTLPSKILNRIITKSKYLQLNSSLKLFSLLAN